MRSAQYLRTLAPHDVASILDMLIKCGLDVHTARKRAQMCYITRLLCDMTDDARRHIVQTLLPKGAQNATVVAVYCTLYATPHIDEATLGDYTVGLVLGGDHELFTGNGRYVCDLNEGVVYLLANKRQHGACPRRKVHSEKPVEPLLFVTVDFHAESMREALKMCG